MSMSLREQLLAAGLVSKKQAEQAERQQKQKHHQHAKGKPSQADEARRAAQQAQAAKAARDQELNLKRQQEAEQKARAAQIRQLIDENRSVAIYARDLFFEHVATQLELGAELLARILERRLVVLL